MPSTSLHPCRPARPRPPSLHPLPARPLRLRHYCGAAFLALCLYVADGALTASLIHELEQAGREGNLAKARWIVSLGIEPGATSGDEISDQFTDPALVLAAEHGHLELVRFLLDRGAPVNQLAWPGESALSKAAQREDLPMVELLLARGADPNFGGEGHGDVVEKCARNPRLRELLGWKLDGSRN